MKENRKLLKEALRDIQKDMTDEEVLALLADSRVSVNPAEEKAKYTLGQRAADAIAKFAGSWAFIFSFTGGLVLWMVVNTVLAARAFDPYPFILLNLVLSCIAAIQAPHRTNRKKLKHFYAELSVCSSFVLPDFMPEECHAAVDFS